MSSVVLVARQSDETSRLIAEFKRHGLDCTSVDAGQTALDEVIRHAPDLLVVDMGEPGADHVCRRIREERELPVLALTRPDMAPNIDSYVDDFVLRPGNDHEVIIRARRLLRKTAKPAPERITTADIVIDTASFEVIVSGKPVTLTFREYELLKFLAANPGRVFTRDALLNRVWGQDFFGGDRTVDVHIRRLRSKIEDPTHTYIETVRNIGYRFVKKVTTDK